MTNLKYFEGMSPEQTMKKIEEERRKNVMEDKKRLVKGIVEGYYIWDMRCWYKYKDEKEVREWIENGCKPNNCGHVVYCINELMNKHNFTVEQIIELVMRNPHKEYEKRIVPCFRHPDICPRYLENMEITVTVSVINASKIKVVLSVQKVNVNSLSVFLNGRALFLLQ